MAARLSDAGADALLKGVAESVVRADAPTTQALLWQMARQLKVRCAVCVCVTRRCRQEFGAQAARPAAYCTGWLVVPCLPAEALSEGHVVIMVIVIF